MAKARTLKEFPPNDEAERCIALRKFSKSVGMLSPEDSEFCRRMWKKYPKWYEETEERVFNETVPFGSQARYRRGTGNE